MKPQPKLCAAISKASEAGISVFASAPNVKMSEKIPFPAGSSTVCAIGASDDCGKRADFTSPKAAFMFPGVDLLSAYPRYLSDDPEAMRKLSGCSMACAIAAGTACRILEIATICSGAKVDFESVFELLAKQGGYVMPWEGAIPGDEDNPTSWLRGRFLLNS